MIASLPCRTTGCPEHALYADGTDPQTGRLLHICPACRNARSARMAAQMAEGDRRIAAMLAARKTEETK